MMRNFLIKLNGWQRLGIILSFLWAILWLLYSVIVIFTPPKDVFDEISRELGVWAQLRFIFDCLMKAIIPIIVGWLGIYSTLWLFRWVREGFEHNKKEMGKALPEEKISNRNSRMNMKQKIVFLIGVGIIVLMGLIPPWYYHGIYYCNHGDRPFHMAATLDSEYGFLFFPPDPPNMTDYNDHHDRGVDGWRYFGNSGPCIDLSRLLIQWAVIAIAMAVIVFALKDEKKIP
jgi:hypothetical protein